MPKLKTLEDLRRIREKTRKTIRSYRVRVLVCGGTGCTAGGSKDILDSLQEEVARRHLEDVK